MATIKQRVTARGLAAASILVSAGTAMALPPLTGHGDDALSVTWTSVAFPAFNGATDMHQHWKNQNLNGVNGKFKTYAAWDDANWRYQENLDRPLAKALDGFDYGHGFMNVGAVYGYDIPNPATEPAGTPQRRPVPAAAQGLLPFAVNQWMTTVNQDGLLNSNGVSTVTKISFNYGGLNIGPLPGWQIQVRFADVYRAGTANGGVELPFPDYNEIDPHGTWGGNPNGANTSDGVLAYWTPAQRSLTFNAKVQWFFGNSNDPTVAANQYDFLAVALHEWGHVIGLDHPNAAAQFTTMYPSMSERGLMNAAQLAAVHTIDADSVDGARGLYTIPTPGSVTIMGIAGLIAFKRRRAS
jgi:hypothetical protein